MKICFPIPEIWEYTSGFRAYRVALIQDALAIFGNQFIDLKGMGFTGTVEKLVKFRMMGARAPKRASRRSRWTSRSPDSTSGS
jgi:dolichol-phosphate mannosyltransferase